MSDPCSSHSSRWKPVRAGIGNIWEYDDHVFEFADGRLVLRGPNGSGKSNALALLVPFLLDGVMAANRMDSLSGGRSMKTLLLCLNDDDERSRRFRHDQRTGYAWLEFERDGTYTTIGCGARASSQRDADAWFFVTPRRPGIDLELAPGGIPLSRAGLVEQIGAGAVHDSADAHRFAVDRALFGLGSHRYRNLIELLLVLRRPHLAGKLNLEHLSKVLSDGLAALGDQLIADVAASFEDLDAVKNDLNRLEDAHRTVQSFLPVYRRYLRSAARARALASIDAEAALRAAHRRAAQASETVHEAGAEVERVRAARQSCDARREIAAQRQRAVIESPAYRDAQSLIEVQARATDAQDSAAKAGQRASSAASESEQTRAAADAAAVDERSATDHVDKAFAAVGAAADRAGAAWSISRAEVGGADLARAARGSITLRRQDIADVRQALAAAGTDAVRAAASTETAARSAGDAETAEGTRRDAAATVDGERLALSELVREWTARRLLSDLDLDLDPVAAAVPLLGDPGAPTLNDVLTEVLIPHHRSVAARLSREEARKRQLAERRTELAAERARVANDPVPAPERLPTRPSDRTGRAGAPLYACTDFVAGVPISERAGLEAALEAAGLLDAWVGAAASDLGESLDAWLEPGVAVAGPNLGDILVATPPPGSSLSDQAVRRALCSIALAEAGIAVLADGRYHLGPLHGRFAKPAAEFIGAAAREQRRQRQLAELDALAAAVRAELADVEQHLVAIAWEQRALDEIAASLPLPTGLLAARDALVAAVASARASRLAADRDEQIARLARQGAERSQSALVTLAADRQLPANTEELIGVEQLVRAYEQCVNELVNLVARHAASVERAAQATARSEDAHTKLAAARRDHDELALRAQGLDARAAQLRAQLGSDADAPLRELVAIEQELADLRNEGQQLNHAAELAAEARGRAGREREHAAESVAQRSTEAGVSAMRLNVLRREDIWSAVTPEGSPPLPDRPRDLSALVAAATAGEAAEPDVNAVQRAFRQLLDDLRRGYNPGLAYIDEVAIVEVVSDTGTLSVLQLADELAVQVSRQRDLLTERDREIFERHLLTRVSDALRDLLNDADELVAGINRSLADRPTASGKSVHLRWEIDSADPTVRSAVALLRRSPELLGPDERDQLRRFFSAAIAQRRAEDAAAGYTEILRHVLDHRTWHAFVPYIRSAGGGSQRLTPTVFRTLSGGEQAVVLHLPLFAAAAAHYDLAGAGAPRLVALDEAFAGIDEGMRAELMGLLVRFDLDVLLTGHELWGAYEQVPELIVYDLLRRPPLPGVSAVAVRWDGAVMSGVPA